MREPDAREAADSPTHRLLDELSWEGNARKYRGGGQRLENVLTAEVFGHLDLLPRQAFLAQVLHAATGADQARQRVIREAEDLAVEVLPGDLTPMSAGDQPREWAVQPDVLLEGAATFTYVEAKAARGGRFPVHQIARTLHATLEAAGDRTPLVLLVLAAPPPLPVQGRGRLDIEAALDAGLDDLPQGDAARLRAGWRDVIAWITWQQIAEVVQAAQANPLVSDPSVTAALDRTAARVVHAIRAAYHR